MTTGRDGRECSHKPRNTEGGLQHQMLGRRRDPLPRPSEAHSPADALTPALASRVEKKISVVASTRVTALCYGSHEKVTHFGPGKGVLL